MNSKIVKYLPEESNQNKNVIICDNKHYDFISLANLVKDYLIHSYMQKFNFKRIQLFIENKCPMHDSKIDNLNTYWQNNWNDISSELKK